MKNEFVKQKLFQGKDEIKYIISSNYHYLFDSDNMQLCKIAPPSTSTLKSWDNVARKSANLPEVREKVIAKSNYYNAIIELTDNCNLSLNNS